MNTSETSRLDLLEFVAMTTRIMNRAVRKAQLENWAHGLPNTYRINGRLYYAMPDGRMLQQEEYDKAIGASRT